MQFFLKKEDVFLIIIFIIMAASVLIKSYFTSHGYLTPDSINYLNCAQNLIDGNGYFLSLDGETGIRHDFFATWPVGYPTLIFLVAKLTGLSVFLASKVLNILAIGTILYMFYSLFKENAYIYGLIFFFSSYLEVYTYTWSEAIFIFALFWFTTLIYKLIENPKNNFSLFAMILISSILLFLIRYIGAFSAGIVGLLGVYYFVFKKDNIRAIIIIFISFLNIVFILGYLYHNYLETGFYTGVERLVSTETNFQLFLMLVKAFMAEMVVPIHKYGKLTLIMLSIQFLIVSFLIWKYRMDLIKFTSLDKLSTLSLIFSIIGLAYLFFIVLLRWIVFFDDYSFRLLSPGTFLLLIAFITYIIDISSEKGKKIFIVFILIFSLISLLLYVPIKTFIKYKQYESSYSMLNNKSVKTT